MEFKCLECEKVLPYVLLDGYIVGGGMVEEVMFKIILLPPANTLEAFDVDKDSQDYFKQFNWDYWMKLATSTALEHDLFQCPECQGAVPNPTDAYRKSLTNVPVPTVAMKTNLEKIIG